MKILLLSLLLTSCMNPEKVIEDKQIEFATNYKDNFVTYQSSGRDMRFAWSGDSTKRPLLFIHGSPGSYKAWAQFLVDKKLQSEFHIIAVDRPGYGGSGQTSELSVQKQADEISEALKFNKSGLKAIAIGHSYGGPVIARLAMDHPDKIGGLIFVAGALDPEFEDIKWYQYLATWKIFKWLVPNNLVVCNEEVMSLKSELDQMMPLWSSVKTPAVIIQGDEDPLVMPGNLKFLKDKLTNSKVVTANMTPGLNHFVPWKRPDLIYDGIENLKPYLQ